MKKIYLALLLLSALSSCEEEKGNVCSLSGEIKGLGTDTLYLYGTDMMYNRTDTLPVEKDRFSLELEMDTLVSAWLEFGDGARYPLFLDKGKRLTVKGTAGDVESLTVTGSQPNDELTAFRKELLGPVTPSEAVLQQKADSFIRSHPASVASVYLLDKYFVQVATPDFDRIEQLINAMAGNLKDRPHIEQLLELSREAEKTVNRRQAPFLQVPNAKGERINRNDFSGSYLLIHFWASWNPQSLQANADLRRLYQREKKDNKKKSKKEKPNFALWGISLDLNRREWEATIKRDTLEWEQSCDFQGWNSQPVRQLSIETLPANLLVSPTGRIEGVNLSIDEIEEKVKEIKEEARKKKN